MAKKNSGIISSAVAQLRRYVTGNGQLLRHGKRFETQLPVVVTLLGNERSRARSLPAKTSLVGYTRDVSETGLTLLLPSVRVGDAYMTDGGCRLRVKLELPGGAVTMMTTSIRFEQLARREAGCSYLLAVHIVEMQKDERERYGKYLKAAGGKGKAAHEGIKAQAAAAATPQAAPNGNAQLGAWDALTPASVNKAFEKFLSK